MNWKYRIHIKTGILTLRSVESKNVLYDRAVDISLPILKAILPAGDITNIFQHRLNVAAKSIQLPEDNATVIEQDSIFFRDMLDYLKSDPSSSVYGNHNMLIPPEHENDLNMMINSMLDGDA
ncbi:hypothetical protein E3Q00_04300 [Wallemia mellicola]|nr:hypothetical protein E3Q00_04300 [Wallemia mellicola]